LLARLFNHYVAVSSAVANSLKIDGCKEHKISVIKNGVCLDEFKISRNDNLGSKSSIRPWQILMVGRLDVEKNYSLAIETFLNMEMRGIRFHARIAGEGPLRDSLSAAVQEKLSRSECVEFLGFRTDIRDLIHEADLLLHLALDEACSLFLIEGMVCGKKILALPNGGIKEIVPISSWLSSHDPKVISDEIEKALVDPYSRTALSRADLDNYRTEASAKRMADQYAFAHAQLSNKG
jgi:glycosyltransferase involved in cell wall biosynthesis